MRAALFTPRLGLGGEGATGGGSLEGGEILHITPQVIFS